MTVYIYTFLFLTEKQNKEKLSYDGLHCSFNFVITNQNPLCYEKSIYMFKSSIILCKLVMLLFKYQISWILEFLSEKFDVHDTKHTSK